MFGSIHWNVRCNRNDATTVEMTEKIAYADDHFHDYWWRGRSVRHEEAAKLVYLGLYALQHRGQESAGIVSTDGKDLYSHRAMGEVEEIYAGCIEQVPGSASIGHTRYSTAAIKRC